MKTIADWKSKTQLNTLDADVDNDENNIRGGGRDMRIPNSILTGASTVVGSSNRLFQACQMNGGAAGTSGTSTSRINLATARGEVPASENSIKAEKYLDIVKDLKKKYSRSKTEVFFPSPPSSLVVSVLRSFDASLKAFA